MKSNPKNCKTLDIGCARNKIPNAIGIDIDEKSQADILHDLNSYPYPIEDNSIDRIYAKHIIEHLNDPKRFIKEISRILKPGGRAFIETPHFSCRVAYSEPQHKLFYSYFMFNNLLSDIDGITVIRQEITFYKAFRFAGVKYLANKYPDIYERFWTYIFPAENIKLSIRKDN